MAVDVLKHGGVTALDYRCEARPGDKPFPEMHGSMSVSYVRSGSFGYRVRGTSYELVAGSVLVGKAGDEFLCTHEYAHGDECLSFHLAPEIAEEIAGEDFWSSRALPPLAQTAAPGELAQAASEKRAFVGIDEAALLLAHRCASLVSTNKRDVRASERDRRRAVEAALWLDEHCGEDVGLAALAEASGLSAFHFLRIFTRVVGVTPHQYLVRSRLRRAARDLAVTDRPIVDVALECGFNDLANFTRAFRRAAGRPPSAYRNFCKA